MKKLFAIFAVILLVIFAGVLWADYNSEWRKFQTTYYKLAQERAQDPRVKKAIAAKPVEVKQVLIERFGEPLVDRCQTCHVGVEDPNFAAAPQPLRYHQPRPPHSFAEYGCVLCHQGNGRGLTKADAHGEGPFWQEPVLKGKEIQAACATCHPYPYLNSMDKVKRGRELYFSSACYGCHTIAGLSDGRIGPELTLVGNRFTIIYIKEKIADPASKDDPSLMPLFALSPPEREALAIFLKSRNGRNYRRGPLEEMEQVEALRRKGQRVVPVNAGTGEMLFQEKGCTACHLVNGKGGLIGPELSVEGLQRDKEWIIGHLIDPRAYVPGSIMPAFHYSRSEAQALGAYLVTLKKRTVTLAETLEKRGIKN